MNFDYLEPYQRAGGHYRLGQCFYRQKSYAEAERQYKLALREYSHKGAKRALDRMKERKKDGTLVY